MRIVLLFVSLALGSCITVRKLEVTPVDYEGAAEQPIIASPVKAHLEDGSTVVFPQGVSLVGGEIRGEGFKYDITLERSEAVTSIDVDDIAAMESYQTPVNTGVTAAASGGVSLGVGVAGLGLLKAIFGSCPTTYSFETGTPILESESFSYSIAPGFEARDVDRLGIDSRLRASVSLEMRNEALETHYINQVELLEVVHGEDESVYPDNRGRLLAVRSLREPRRAVDQGGRDVRSIVGVADGAAWSTTAERLQHVSAEDLEDYIELEFEASPAARQQALVLRMRNSLLNTVLLYDVILRGQGYRAIDWMGADLDRLGPKYRLARWYKERMGMRVSVWDGRRFRQVAAVPDTGPIAWKELAVPLPDAQAGTVRVRLSFTADNWRIDRVALASMAREARPRAVPLAEVTSSAGDRLPQARSNLRAADEAYVITRPGEYLTLKFDLGRVPEGRRRTLFLAAEGYYIEWMRAEWLQATGASAFAPNDAALLSALALWEERRAELRDRFESTRIPVR
ncbi:MAG TPA: hypothetical protein VFG91_01685 [Woeseiaceae bacterium]|nr:hypothetical protein [Woeseiaceae bacterium]